MSSDIRARLGLGFVLAAALAVAISTPRGAAPRFYPDDPIQTDPDTRFDAGGAQRLTASNGYDFVEHTFIKPGEKADRPARNVNTMDEVPDSMWFTNRIGRRSMSIDEIARGPNVLDALDVNGWPIVEEKSSGITPGFRVRDPNGRLHQIKFDPPANPEMASGAEIVGAAIYHALGYHVVQGYVGEIDPARIVIAPTATTTDLTGTKRPMGKSDVDRILERAARLPNGFYRATISRFADGRPLGSFKYHGTRPDDPNDIHPHEHRRELRANRVFAAWLNHDDSRGINSLDMLEGEPGRQYIRHYMFDFGSIMGSGSTTAQAPRAGNEYILEWKPSFKTLATLGFWTRPWTRVDYPKVSPSVGRFEAEFFDPVAWRPEYPNPAFDMMRPDDAFWGARLVSKFSDAAIRAIVAKARYSDPKASEYIATTLVKRRDKVLKAWLIGVNPIVEPAIAPDGTLTFENAAVSAGVATRPEAYVISWSRFDNATGTTSGVPVDVRSTETRTSVPSALADVDGYVVAEIKTIHPGHPSWALPVRSYFRRIATGWQTVGLERTIPPSAKPD